MSNTHTSPPTHPKHPLSLNQVSRLTGRTRAELDDAVRAGKLRLTMFFERSRRVTQADFEAWLRSEGLMLDDSEVADGGK